ncbi:AbrB/MazE/SpoVT family DNA-binding domain-containing protein [Variovorax sp. J2P1-59]|uniref:AbrB/MazE/SpoVT family DNA-binding domain-containing protein n=1 Tax=Variovorax flavidus TaxID=3053501 RepID=UPI002577E40C|nr:AbrB/MazE/SpoVT family DNA-binding domain-containing protein [Variovorax sp. J2P1-59]MDM0076253.1 AbrB/MazE/SpoVT family DNA-binding domain-containing protein [Variovorax sp. J2P1-59]
MLAKMTSKNQLTLPRSVTDQIGATDYFDVEVREGQIVLTPVRIQRGDALRAKLAALGLTSADVQGAIDWARQTHDRPAPVAAEPEAAYHVTPNRSGGAKATKPRRKA